MENQRDSKTTQPTNVYSRRRGGSSSGPCPLKNYLHWADPKPDSPAAVNTPVKVEEDVIVTDEIPAPKSSEGGSEVRTKSSKRDSKCKVNFDTPCRYWKTFGTCASRSKCQYVHVGEELQHPPSSSGDSKQEILESSSNLEGSASPSYGKNKSPTSPAKPPSAAEEALSSPSLPAAMALSTAPVQAKHLSGSAIPSSTAPEAYQSGTDWSPLDDGIEIDFPSTKNPPKEEVDAYIEEVLSGTTSRMRLPVFEKICPK